MRRQVSLVDTVQQGKVGAIPLMRGDKSPLSGYGVNDYRCPRLLAVCGGWACFLSAADAQCLSQHAARSVPAAGGPAPCCARRCDRGGWLTCAFLSPCPHALP